MSPTDTCNIEVLNHVEDPTNKDDVEPSNETVVPDESKLKRLYIDGLPLTTTENEIKSYFEKLGKIEECLLTTSTTTILCCLTFASANCIDGIQASRPHRIGHTVLETRRVLPDGRPVKKLYVGSIKGGTTTGHIFAAFSRFGRVRAVDMIKDKFTGRCRGFCFVSFDDYDSADKCILETPLVLNHKVVRVQKAIPISEMTKVSGNSNDKPVNPRVPCDNQTVRYRESRESVSSTDTDLSDASSVFENVFDLAPLSCTMGPHRKEFGFSNSKSVRHYSYPVYKNHYAKDTTVDRYPSSLPVRNCLSYKPGTTDLKAPYMNTVHNGFVPYLNDSTSASLRCPIYSDNFAPYSAPPNGYPLSYNVACSNVQNRNLCFPFVFNNQSVPYSPLPTAPMFIPFSVMCNYTRPSFAGPGPYQNPYIR